MKIQFVNGDIIKVTSYNDMRALKEALNHNGSGFIYLYDREMYVNLANVLYVLYDAESEEV